MELHNDRVAGCFSATWSVKLVSPKMAANYLYFAREFLTLISRAAQSEDEATRRQQSAL
jgi:hypothetical protein